LIALLAFGYTTAADLDAPKVRRRWDVAGHGAESALARLRHAGMAHGPNRMGRRLLTDAGAAAAADCTRVIGRVRPDALARRV
jgi:hypothetical protein